MSELNTTATKEMFIYLVVELDVILNVLYNSSRKKANKRKSERNDMYCTL